MIVKCKECNAELEIPEEEESLASMCEVLCERCSLQRDVGKLRAVLEEARYHTPTRVREMIITVLEETRR